MHMHIVPILRFVPAYAPLDFKELKPKFLGMIDLSIEFQPGFAKNGMIILAKYNDTERLAYILKAPFGGDYMQIQDTNGDLVAQVTELAHLAHKSDWSIDFEDERPAVLLKPHDYFSSKWTAEFDGGLWNVGSGRDHKVTSGSIEIGLVKTSHYSSGARRVTAVNDKDVLTLVGFAGAIYLHNLKQTAWTATPGVFYY